MEKGNKNNKIKFNKEEDEMRLYVCEWKYACKVIYWMINIVLGKRVNIEENELDKF